MPSVARHTIAVIGNGPLGSSTARALITSPLASRLDITLFDSTGALWSSHDDRGRLTRIVDFERQPEWVAWNRASLLAWRGLERDGGRGFFTACGSAIVADEAVLTDLMATQLGGEEGVRAVGTASLLPAGVLGGEADGVPPGAILEERGGYVDPVDLVAAQNAVFTARGGTIVRDVVSGLRALPDPDGGGGVALRTSSDETEERVFHRAILCAGGFTNELLRRSHGLGPPLPYDVSRRTVLLGRVSESTRLGPLADMPVLKVAVGNEGGTEGETGYASERDAREAGSVYILPPILYPELGGYFVKLGGGANDFIECEPEQLAGEIEAWRNAPPHAGQVDFLRSMARRVLPGVGFEEFRTKNCVTTSCGDEPLFRESRAEGSVLCIANAQGKGVMSSYAIGDEVASIALKDLLGRGDCTILK